MSQSLAPLELVAGAARDVATVDALMQAAFDPRFGEAWTAGQCLGVLAMPGVWLTIARLDARPAGFALARAVAGDAELLLLATLPAVRRRGIGGALLRSILADARAREATRIHLEVRAGNDAVALYTRAGFAQVGRRRGYYCGRGDQLHDAHTYSLEL